MPARGSNKHLLQLCLAYFLAYTAQGVGIKVFRDHGMSELALLLYKHLRFGLAGACRLWFTRRWLRHRSAQDSSRTTAFIVLAGVCTAVIIPMTTLLYTLPITVMVAMTIMRASIIVVSRVVDAVQLRQGILKHPVSMWENVAVLFALGAVAIQLKSGRGDEFAFVRDPTAMAMLSAYVVAYALRIYIMNYYKHTRGTQAPADNRGYFAMEQMSATAVLIVVLGIVLAIPGHQASLPNYVPQCMTRPPAWGWAIIAGVPFGLVAFFSVFIFMFHGRSATFATLANRLTSLLAGTAATAIHAGAFGGPGIAGKDALALVCVVVAMACLTLGERARNTP